MDIGCVVKAAGRSRRFGEKDKLLAPLGGMPVLARAISSLPLRRLSRTVAVTSREEVSALCRACGVEPLLYGGGPVSDTIRLGLAAMGDMDGCLFLSGDQPLCGERSLERILSAFENGPDRVVRLSFGGVPGSPVLFPRRLFPRLMALKGEKGGMAAVDEGEDVLLVPAESVWELRDADTPEDLEEMEAYLRRGEDPPGRR